MGQEPINYLDLAIWTILRLRWRDLADYLESAPEMINKIGKSDSKVPNNLKDLFTQASVNDVVNGKDVSSRLTGKNLRKLIER